MSEFICPVCGERLSRADGSMVCPAGHCYDISRRGYVNLLMSQSSSKKRHGDDAEMVAARTEFLSLGLYGKLRDRVTELVCGALPCGGTVADIGCGECYYTENIKNALDAKGIKCDIYGIDISKKALDAAGKRKCGISLAVASAFSIPLADGCADVIINLFAPHEPRQFCRIAKEGATLIRVFPLGRHLWELKCAVYDDPYENEIDTLDFEGFSLVGKEEMKYEIALSSRKQIQNLFTMTPYCYKTSAADREKLNVLSSLKTRVEFCIAVYQKTKEA